MPDRYSPFDADFADAMARLESYNKHLYRPNTYLHKWWARRCGSTFRLILKSLVADPRRRDYYSPGGLEGRVILDPMMGGGTTLHEAIRLGASVIGADIDPIPILQARAALSALPFEQLEEAFDRFYSSLRDSVSPSFATSCPTCQAPTEIQFTLYGACRACRCGPRLIVDSTILRHDAGGAAARICPRCRALFTGEQPCGCPAGEDGPPLVEKGAPSCAACGADYTEDLRRPYYARFQPVATVGRCPRHGTFFAAPSTSDLEAIRQADARRAELGFDPRDFRVPAGPKSSDLLRRGIASYLDLFSSRQLLALRRAIDLLPSFEPLVRLNLALLVSTSLEFNCMLCGYKGGDRRRPGAIRHVFSHHAYSFPYTALENNPLYPAKTSGTLLALFHTRIRRARRWAQRPVERFISSAPTRPLSHHPLSRVPALLPSPAVAGTRHTPIPPDPQTPRQTPVPGELDAGTEVRHLAGLRSGPRRFMLVQGSAAGLDLPSGSVDHVVTDPPYCDSVQYSDLARFFHAWLRHLLPGAAEWEVDLGEAAVDPQSNGDGQYARILAAIFRECHRVLKESGRLVFTFHHWQPRGWAALTQALQQGGFVLVDRHVVHAENPTSVHIANLKALVHDAVLVLAPVESGRGPEWPPPRKIDRAGSRAFVGACAEALGWMLAAHLDAGEIERRWRALL
jgi:putative DNA methylase